MKVKHYLLGGIIVLVVVLLAAFLLTNAKEIPLAYASEAKMQASMSDAAGVDTITAFTLKFKHEISPSAIRRYLSVEPKVKLAVHRGSDKNEILVVPEDALAEGEVYKFTLMAENNTAFKWAFQTKSSVQVMEISPLNQAVEVATDSDIKVSFNYAGLQEAENYFITDPLVNGRFEKEDNILKFIPEDPLHPQTVYTITIKAGLPLANSDQVLEKDYTFSFQTGKEKENQDINWKISSPSQAFASEQVPTFDVEINEKVDREPLFLPIRIYQLASAKDFAEAMLKKASASPFWAKQYQTVYGLEKNSLAEVMNVFLPVNKNQEQGADYVRLPQTLPPGYYLLAVEKDQELQELLFQVSDINAYALPTQKEAVFWLHDQKGAAIKGAEVYEYQGTNKGLTDQDGLLRLSLTSENEQDLSTVKANSGNLVFIVKKNKQSLVIFNDCHEQQGNDATKEFWSYLYNDKNIYKSGDSINFWGFVQARSGYEDIERIRISLYRYDQKEAALMYERFPVKDNSFGGSFTLPTLTAGKYYLQASYGNKKLATVDFEVADFSQAAYRLNVQNKKALLFAEKEAVYDISAKCFEDTPVTGLKVEATLENDGFQKTLQTDAFGHAQLIVPTEADYKDDGPMEDYPLVSSQKLNVEAQSPEGRKINSDAYLEVLKCAVAVDGTVDLSDQMIKVSATVYQTVLNQVAADGDPFHKDQDFFGKRISGQEVVARFYRQDVLRRQIGQEYNSVTGTIDPIYEYDYQYVLLKEKNLISDKEGQVNAEFDCVYADSDDIGSGWEIIYENSSFQVDLVVKDQKNRIMKNKMKVYPEDWYKNNTYNCYLSSDKQYGYAVDENFQVAFLQDDSEMFDRKKAYLFVTARDGIKNAIVQDSAKYDSKFLEQDVPNLWIRGVYFDGAQYHDAEQIPIQSDSKRAALNVEITTDQKSYYPGEEAQVVVNVKNAQGYPVQSKLLISVVDEAAFADQRDGADILQSLYGKYVNAGFGNYFTSYGTVGESLQQSTVSDDVDDKVSTGRQTCSENIFFQQVNTDRNGQGKINLTLPECVSSWKITCLALLDQPVINAGQNESTLIVNRSLHGEIIAGSGYLTKDNPTIFLRAGGKEDEEEVMFSVRLENLAGQVLERYNVQGFLNQQTPLELGELKTGTYSLIAEASTLSGTSSSFMKTLVVEDQYLDANLSDQTELAKKIDLEHSDQQPTLVIFSAQNRGQLFSDLWKLSGNESGRLEILLANQISKEFLSEYNEQLADLFDYSQPDLSVYQNADGGISALPFGESDLFVSMQAASLKKEYFDNRKLQGYFQKIISNSSDRGHKLLAEAGLAALGQPVLQNLQNSLKLKDLTSEEMLAIYWGLIQAGDVQAVRHSFPDYLSENSKKEHNNLEIKGSLDNVDAGERRAVLAMMIAAYCGQEEDYLLLRNYLLSAPEQMTPTDLAIAIGSTVLLPQLASNDSSFTHIVDGMDKKINLQGARDYNVFLTAAQVESMLFKDLQGRTFVTSLYQKRTDEEASQKASLSRSYEVSAMNTEDAAMKIGVMKVSLYYNLPAELSPGTYTITDYMPSGLRFLTSEQKLVNEVETFTSVRQDGQKVSYTVNKEKGQKLQGSFKYYCQAVSGGMLTAEAAALSFDKTVEVVAKTDRDQVTIE